MGKSSAAQQSAAELYEEVFAEIERACTFLDDAVDTLEALGDMMLEARGDCPLKIVAVAALEGTENKVRHAYERIEKALERVPIPTEAVA